MDSLKPGLRNALIAALVLYVIGTCFLITDLYGKVDVLEHNAMHAEFGIPSHGTYKSPGPEAGA